SDLPRPAEAARPCLPARRVRYRDGRALVARVAARAGHASGHRPGRGTSGPEARPELDHRVRQRPVPRQPPPVPPGPGTGSAAAGPPLHRDEADLGTGLPRMGADLRAAAHDPPPTGAPPPSRLLNVPSHGVWRRAWSGHGAARTSMPI